MFICLTSPVTASLLFECISPQTSFTVVTTTSLPVLEMRGGGGEEQEVRGRSTQHPPQMILVKNITKDNIDKCLDR